MNVLITAGVAARAAGPGFQAALSLARRAGRVIVTDVNPLSPAVHVADRAYRVPLATDPDYLDELLDDLRGRAGPAGGADDRRRAAGCSAAARDRFAALGVMRRLLAGRDGARSATTSTRPAAPRRGRRAGGATYLPGELPTTPPLPLFIKPRVGRGAVGAFTVRNERELDFFLGYVDRPGRPGVPRRSRVHHRRAVRLRRAGRCRSCRASASSSAPASSIAAARCKRPALIELAEAGLRGDSFAGPVNIQCRMRGEQPVIFEINPRFSGGIPLTIAGGRRLPAMLLSSWRSGARAEPRSATFEDALDDQLRDVVLPRRDQLCAVPCVEARAAHWRGGVMRTRRRHHSAGAHGIVAPAGQGAGADLAAARFSSTACAG